MPESGSDSATSTGIGSYLREIREARGESLETAAEVTRIGKNYLIAIESEAFDRFPSTSYLKGFLRAYAGHLGVGGDDVIGRYERLAQKQGKGDPSPAAAPGTVPDSGKTRRRSLVAALLVFGCAGVFLMSRQGKVPPAPSVPAVPSSPPAQPLPSPAPSAPQVPSPPPITANKAGQGNVLRLKVNQDSSLTITIDDAISEPYELKAGDLIEWKAEREFTLDIGNAGGIEGELNGRALPPFGEPGKSVHVTLPGGDQSHH